MNSVSRARDGDLRESAAGLPSELPPGVRIVLFALPVIAIAAWLLLAATHMDDRFNVNAVSGALLALADRARDGVLYPPLFDGQSYAGTRTMPVPILLYAVAISAGGELLAPAKLVDFLASLGLVVVLVAVLLRLSAGRLLAWALAATVITSQVFLLPATGIRPESLPTALQLGGVVLIAFGSRRSTTVTAGALCALAIFCKVSAVWAPIAIVVWLMTTDRRQLVLFATALAASLAALLVIFYLGSDGRIVENVVGLGGAGLSLVGVLKAPLKGAELLLQYGQATVLLLPILVLGLMVAGRGSRLTIFQTGLLAASGVALVVMADVGSDYNHLLDVVVLVPIAAWEVARTLANRFEAPRLVPAILGALLMVGCSGAIAENLASSVATTLGLPGGSEPSIGAHPLSAELAGAGTLLAEDPYLPLVRGERPVVTDAFMLLRIGSRDPSAVRPLLARIADGQFDALILNEDLGHPETVAWFTSFAFGLPFYDAMRTSYHLCHVADGYFVYVANSRGCPGG